MANEKKYTTIEVADTLDVEFGAAAEQLLPLIETNNKLAATTKTLTATNKTLAETCQEQAVINDGLADTNAQLTATNSKQATTNAELANSNVELSSTNAELASTNTELSATNKTLAEQIIPTLQAGLQNKSVAPATTTQVVIADDGYLGLHKVTVSPATLEERNVAITANGTVEITPSSAHYGIGKVTAAINVPSTLSGVSSLSFANTAITRLDCIIDTSALTSLAAMFRHCESLEYANIANWNTSNVTTADHVFFHAYKIKTIDLSGWDTSKVTNMWCMCEQTQSLDKFITGDKWDTSHVTNLASFFCNSAVKEADVSKWNVSQCQNFVETFYCTNLVSLDLSNWNMQNGRTYEIFICDDASLKTVIGNHTLAEVEAGTIVACKNMGQSQTDSLIYFDAPLLRYSSLLAVCNGLYTRTSSKSIRFSATAFNNMRNDDDTIPDATTIATRQTTIRTILSNKKYTLVTA